jgi:NADPH:quinone reductase
VKAIVISSTGGFDKLVMTEAPDPEPSAGEVVVDVAYAGCNWGDTQVRAGTYSHPVAYPITPGYEISGTVAALGPGVADVRVGDRVAAIVGRGGYAEKCLAPANSLIHLPDSVGLDIGAAFPIQSATAYHMLFTIFHLKSGDTVLVHAIGGGVGLFCTQLAVRAGARVIGAVGTPGKEKRALEYGAAKVVLTQSEDFAAAAMAFSDGAGVDLAIDSLGGATLDRTFAIVRVLGHIISIGEAEGPPLNNIRGRLMARSQNFTRLSLGKLNPASREWRDGIAYLLAGIKLGWLKVPIEGIFPFDQSGAMHARMESRQASGKLLLKTGRTPSPASREKVAFALAKVG